MARLMFFVVSELVSVDQRTNRASLFNILEEIQAQQFPVLVPYCAATSLWAREDGDEERDFQCILRITVPGEASHDFTSNFRLTRPRHRLVQALQGLVLPSAGALRFELFLNGTRITEYVIDVIQAQPLDVAESTVH